MQNNNYLKNIEKLDKQLEKTQSEYERLQKRQKRLEEMSKKKTLTTLNKQVRSLNKIIKEQDKTIKNIFSSTDKIVKEVNKDVKKQTEKIERTTTAMIQFKLYKLRDKKKKRYNNHDIRIGNGLELVMFKSFRNIVVKYSDLKRFRINYLYNTDEKELTQILNLISNQNDYVKAYLRQLGASASIDGLVITSLTPLKIPAFKKLDLLSLKYKDDNGDKKINNKYTAYEVNKNATDFSDLFIIEYNDYLKKNFRPRCCVLTALINAYYNRFNRIKVDGKRRNTELTYSYLCKILEVEDKASDIGVDIYTVIQKFIKKFNFLSFYVYDAYTNLLIKHQAEDEKDSVSLRILLKDGHVYQLNNDLKSLQQLTNVSEFSEFAVNDKCYIIDFDKQKQDIKFVHSIEDILKEIVRISLIEKSEVDQYKLITSLSLTEILLQLLKSKYTPQIFFQNFIYRISLYVNKFQVSIEVCDSNPIFGEDIIMNDIETYNLYHDEYKKLYNSVMLKEYVSDYHPTIQTIHNEYPILPLIGHFEEYSLKQCSILDQNKAYSHKLMEMDKVPVFNYFDVYQKYNNEAIEDYTYYIIEVIEETETTKIIFDGKICRTFGFVLNSVNEKYKIHYQRKPLKVVNVNFKNAVENLFNNDNPKLTTNMKKIIANKITGMMEIKYNKKYLTKIFDDYNEAENYRLVMDGKIIPLATYKSVPCDSDGLDFGIDVIEGQTYESIDEIHGYLVSVDQKKEQSQGFKPMKDIIYLRQKLEMYKLYKLLLKYKIPVFGVRTDCFYIDENHIKTIKNNAKIFNLGKQIGQFKIEHTKISPETKLTIVDNELIEFENFKVELKTFQDEKDTKTINEYLNNKEPVLIKGEYAGVGKSTLCKNFDKNTLFILPYNKLCQKVQLEGYDAITYSKLFNLFFDDQELKKSTSTNKNIESYSTICFDEALLYTPERLKRIAKFIHEHPKIKVLATGDTDQRNPIGFDNSTYLSMCMNIIFKNQILLKDIKRLNNEKDKIRMKKLKEDIFNYSLSIEEICKRNNIKTIKDYGEVKTLKNICYFNFRCQQVSSNIHFGVLQHEIRYFTGLKIICRVYEKTKINNFQTNYEYKIIKMTKSNIIILNEADGEEQNITMKQLQNNFILPYAFTCDSIQGDSFDEGEKATIFDTNIPHTDRKYFWTGITRVRNLNDIQVFIHSDKEVNSLTKSKMIQYYNFKIDGYKHQDMNANRKIDNNIYVNSSWILDECEKCKYTCKYCSSGLQININEDSNVESNITVNRLDNKIAHHQSNCEICCFHCNVSRK